MAKIEVLSDKVETDKQRLVIEMSIPLDFLREAIRNPETIKATFATAFAQALDEFMTRRNIEKK